MKQSWKVFCLTLLLSLKVTCLFSEVVIILNPSITETSIDNQLIKEIFLGKYVTWLDKTPVKLAVLNQGKTHLNFLKKVINKTPDQYKSYLLYQTYLGKSEHPRVFNNEESLIEYVQNTEGAIGYASSNLVEEKVNVLEIP